MNKFIKAMLAGAMAMSMAACSSAPASSGTAGSAAEGSSTEPEATELAVAMVTDYGDITDQSFNQTTYEFAKAWAEANGAKFNYYKPATDADADRESSIETAIEDGFNVIVMPGFAFAKAVVDEADSYPDVTFIALDVSQYDLDSNSGEENWSRDNVSCIVYQEEIAGYFAGVAAVKLGYKKIGFLGGMAVPAVIRYGYGFVQGAEAAATELGLTDVECTYAYGGQFYGDADITARMDTWYAAGTEVVFASGGGIYDSAAEAAVKTNGKVIGVDVDQAPTIDAKYGEGLTVTSAMKGLGATVNTLLDAVKAGEFGTYGGQVTNLGVVSDDSAKNYVGIPASTQWNDSFTEEDYNALVKAINAGEVKIDNAIDVDLAAYTGNVKVTFEGQIK